ATPRRQVIINHWPRDSGIVDWGVSRHGRSIVVGLIFGRAAIGAMGERFDGYQPETCVCHPHSSAQGRHGSECPDDRRPHEPEYRRPLARKKIVAQCPVLSLVADETNRRFPERQHLFDLSVAVKGGCQSAHVHQDEADSLTKSGRQAMGGITNDSYAAFM